MALHSGKRIQLLDTKMGKSDLNALGSVNVMAYLCFYEGTKLSSRKKRQLFDIQMPLRKRTQTISKLDKVKNTAF